MLPFRCGKNFREINWTSISVIKLYGGSVPAADCVWMTAGIGAWLYGFRLDETISIFLQRSLINKILKYIAHKFI